MIKRLLLAFASVFAMSSPVLAQGIDRKPATTQDILKYQYLAGVNICILTQKGIGLKEAFPASNLMVAMAIKQLNGSEIIEGSKTIKLTDQQLENGGVPGIASAVEGLCGKNLKGEDKTEFDKLKTQIRSLVESAKKKQ